MKNILFKLAIFTILVISSGSIAKAQLRNTANGTVNVSLKISDNLIIVPPPTTGPTNIDFVYNSIEDFTSDKIMSAPVQLGVRSLHPYDLVLKAESDFVGQTKNNISIPLNVMRVSVKDTEKANYTQETIPSTTEQVLLNAETKTPPKGRTYDVIYKIPKSEAGLLFKTESQKYLTNFIYSFVVK